MLVFIQKIFKRNRLIFAGLALYILGMIGFIAPQHHHDLSQASDQHTQCQLCQVSSEVFLAPVLLGCIVFLSIFYKNILGKFSAFINLRFQPYSSRGPPLFLSHI